jgi:5-methylcytosine-specific restriction endonuclease McrA
MLRPCLGCDRLITKGSRCPRCNRIRQARFNTPTYKAARSVAIKRDGACVVCGKTHGLHAHHVTRYRHNASDDPAGLVALCASCHRRVEMGTARLPNRGRTQP